MSKAVKTNPRILKSVLQAIADLQDVNGSTTRKILRQVQSALSVANKKLKPRNVAMQVRKALKRAVESGAVRQRGGKYKLVMDSNAGKDYARKRCGKHRKPRKCKKPNRRLQRRKRKPCKKPCKKPCHAAARQRSTTATNYSTNETNSSLSSHTDSEVKIKGRQRRRRSRVRNSRRKHRRNRSRKMKRRRYSAKRTRQPTPIPTKPDQKSEMDSESAPSERGTTRAGSRYQQDDMENFTAPHDIDTPPECDNPDCLCNLKQEPFDDVYDDINGAGCTM